MNEDAHPHFCAGRKLSDIDKALLWQILHDDPECPTRALLDTVAHMQRALAVRVRHLNRWRATWGLNRRKGRPRHVACSTAASGALVQVTPHLSYVGVHLFMDKKFKALLVLPRVLSQSCFFESLGVSKLLNS
jgi:hypothetical protein